MSEMAAKERRERLAAARLYFITEARPVGRDGAEIARAAIEGGAEIVQLRDKDADDEQVLAAAERFRAVCAELGALFVVNDRPDLAAACGADGVHVGQQDATVAEAREVVGPDALIGLSTHSREQIEAAVAADPGPDYISVGPVWETPTKPGRPGVGIELVRVAAEISTLPFFVTGGVDAETVGEVVTAGADRVVAVRAIRDAEDPQAAALALRGALG